MTSGELEGSVVAGKYLVHEKIGQGGMGDVFRAEQLPLNRKVALKLLRPELAASDELVDKLIQEARFLASVEHDAIVRVIDVDRTAHGQPFIVLEYLDGVSLDRLLTEHGFLPWRWAANAVLQVLSATEMIHRSGLVHLDIKPANCLNVGSTEPLRYAPRTKLIDFGIARMVSRLTGAPAIGTPAYWAPEQAGASNVDERTDVYSIGATFYELLTGKTPSAGKRRTPSDCNPAGGIPADLDRIVMQALESEPSQRYPDASSFQESLAAVLGEGASRTTLPSAMVRSEPAPSVTIALDEPPADAQLLRLRRKVQAFWVNGVLGVSNDSIALAVQERTLEQELIAGPASSLESACPIPVPGHRSMYSVYDEHGRTLLITGGPGSGKTTQMLLLARDLLNSESRSVPVIFTLSTWQHGALSLGDWMVSELYSKYQVPRTLAAKWILDGRILPLLDGLDEMSASQRASCVKAINAFIDAAAQSLSGLVVTCRLEEYGETREKLAVGIAVRMHDLAMSSVAEYLRRYANHSDKQRLLMDEELVSLLRTPLMLNLMASLDAQTVAAIIGAAGPDRLDQLWDAHVKRMVTRSGKRRLPMAHTDFLATLQSLALAMKRQNQTIFQLDDLQPDALGNAPSRVVYFLGSRLGAAAVAGAGVILSLGLTPLENMGFRADLAFGAALGLSTALAGGILHGGFSLLKRRAAPVPLARRAHWLTVGGLGILTGLVNAAVVGPGRHFFAAILAFEVGFFAAPLLSPHPDVGRPHADIRPVEAIRFSLRRAARAVPYALVVALVAASFSFRETESHAVAASAFYAFAMCLLLAGLREREVETRVVPNGGIRRSIRISTGLAGIGFAITAIGMGWIYGPSYGACAGLTSAAALWLWYGGLATIEHVVLRLLLRWSRLEYCDVAFLDAAANRGLLHRVGGGYMFVHPTLMERLVAQAADRTTHYRKSET
jgi:serine/threonine protein kinase/energy-coupling factor transporter ATP-binding protein EcfA2